MYQQNSATSTFNGKSMKLELQFIYHAALSSGDVEYADWSTAEE